MLTDGHSPHIGRDHRASTPSRQLMEQAEDSTGHTAELDLAATDHIAYPLSSARRLAAAQASSMTEGAH
jgi:hypothetical protein